MRNVKKLKKLTVIEAQKMFELASTKMKDGHLPDRFLHGIAMLFDVSAKTVQRVVNRRGRFKDMELYIDIDVSDL